MPENKESYGHPTTQSCARIVRLKLSNPYITNVEYNTMKSRFQSSSVTVAKATARSMYEFVRALTTLLVAGLFVFYSYVTAIGTIQSIQSGLFGEAVALFGMFTISLGAMVYSVGIINGVIEYPV